MWRWRPDRTAACGLARPMARRCAGRRAGSRGSACRGRSTARCATMKARSGWPDRAACGARAAPRSNTLPHCPPRRATTAQCARWPGMPRATCGSRSTRLACSGGTRGTGCAFPPHPRWTARGCPSARWPRPTAGCGSATATACWKPGVAMPCSAGGAPTVWTSATSRRSRSTRAASGSAASMAWAISTRAAFTAWPCRPVACSTTCMRSFRRRAVTCGCMHDPASTSCAPPSCEAQKATRATASLTARSTRRAAWPTIRTRCCHCPRPCARAMALCGSRPARAWRGSIRPVCRRRRPGRPPSSRRRRSTAPPLRSRCRAPRHWPSPPVRSASRSTTRRPACQRPSASRFATGSTASTRSGSTPAASGRPPTRVWRRAITRSASWPWASTVCRARARRHCRSRSRARCTASRCSRRRWRCWP